MNSTSSTNIDFLDVAAATATVAGCLATLAALIGIIMHRNASFCAALINFVCCCRKRSNRVASSLHLRRAGGALAELGGVVIHPTPPAPPAGFQPAPENIYIEPAELVPPDPAGTPSGQAFSLLVEPVGAPEATAPQGPPLEIAPVFNRITPQQHIELELLRPPPAGRAKKTQVRADSFKL